MMRIFLLLIAVIALVCGVKFIYDARPIVKKYFRTLEMYSILL